MSSVLVAPFVAPLPLPPATDHENEQVKIAPFADFMISTSDVNACMPSPPGSGHECLPPPPPFESSSDDFQAVNCPNVFAHQEQGPRDTQEDMMVAFQLDHYHVIGLFDGHGGSQASLFCQQNLHQVFTQMTKQYQSIVEVLYFTIRELETQFLPKGPVPLAVASYISGCTLEIAVLDKRDRKLYTAHLGDSRMLLVNKDGTVQQITTDHLWTNPSEQARMTQMPTPNVGIIGRRIVRTSKPGAFGQFVSLEVSRAFGDPFFKPWVSSEPEIKVVAITDQTLAVVAFSDGVVNVVSNDQIGQIVVKHKQDSPSQIVTADLARKSGDNSSFMVMLV